MIQQLIIALLVIMFAYTILLTHNVSMRAKAKLWIFSIYMMGILLWPVLWSALLKENTQRSSSIPCLVWPIFILSIEIYLLKYHTFEQQVKKNKSLLSMDANAICSLTFALSSILGANRDACCKNIFIYGVLGCIAFVMPSPQTPSDTLESIIIDHVQKVILTYSTGLLLGGSMLLMNNDKNMSKS